MQNISRRDEYLKRLIDRRENGLIKVITGIRRCGKSFLLFRLFYDYLIESGENLRLYNVLNDLMRLRNVDIYVTGSNSKMLTKDVLTAFRGRGDEVRIYLSRSRNTMLSRAATKPTLMKNTHCMAECHLYFSKKATRKK